MGNQVQRIEALKERTKKLALRIIRLFQVLPHTEEARILGKQMLRAATSVAANYRATCRARSDAEAYSKISIVVEEADETMFWLELLEEAGIMPHEKLALLLSDYLEIVKITNATRQKIKGKLNKPEQ